MGMSASLVVVEVDLDPILMDTNQRETCGFSFMADPLPREVQEEIRKFTRETCCFMAHRPPEELMIEINKVQDRFMKAQNKLTTLELMASLPNVYPFDKSVDKDKLPGIGRFPVDQWIRDGKPCLDARGWIALAMKIAAKDLDALSGIFDLGKRLGTDAELVD